jgi:DNA modification methylase
MPRQRALVDWIQGMGLPTPYYRTQFGAAFLGNSNDLLSCLPAESVDLIVTSPPFALRRKKEYGNVPAGEYVAWFRGFSRQFQRVLKEKGSLVIDIGGSWNAGEPTRSLYQYELLLDLAKLGFKLCQDFFWFNPSRLPSPAEWVNVRRIRVKDAVDPIWWMSKSAYPNANNRRVLGEYSESMVQLIRNGYKAKLRPSGWDISSKFQKDNGGAIPPNLIQIANTESNSWYLRACARAGVKPHPARFPAKLPRFFIDFLSEPGDVVLDPFAGSNVSGEAAEEARRRWVAFELVEDYLIGSRFRFERPRALDSSQVRSKRAQLKLGQATLTGASSKAGPSPA